MMGEFNLFRLDCFVVNGAIRNEKVAHINPTFVVSIERDHGITKIITTNNIYYSAYNDELIIKGLQDVWRKNNRIVSLN